MLGNVHKCAHLSAPSLYSCIQPTTSWVCNIAQEEARVCGARHTQRAHFSVRACGYPLTSSRLPYRLASSTGSLVLLCCSPGPEGGGSNSSGGPGGGDFLQPGLQVSFRQPQRGRIPKVPWLGLRMSGRPEFWQKTPAKTFQCPLLLPAKPEPQTLV